MLASSFSQQAAADLELIKSAAIEGGEIAMGHFRSDPDVWYKNGGRSPVSAADVEVDKRLRSVLLAARPQYGWLSEETEDDDHRLSTGTQFVVDPIDGTRAFLAGKDVWCVSIAVVHNGAPVAGVLVAPARGEVFSASIDAGAMCNGEKICTEIPRASQIGKRDLRVSIPDSLANDLTDPMRSRIERVPHIPSLAYRIAMVADGRLHGTLVRKNSNDWDLAGADIILREAGGALVDTMGTELIYNRRETTRGALAAAGRQTLPEFVNVLGNN